MQSEEVCVFQDITLEDIRQSDINTKINEYILYFYDSFFHQLQDYINITSKRKTAFDLFISRMTYILNGRYNMKILDAIKFGGYSVNQLFIDPYIGDRDVITEIKKLERNILNNILYKEELFGIKSETVSDNIKLYTVKTLLRTLTMREKDIYEFKYKAYSHSEFNRNNVIEYTSIPKSFYYDFLLKNLSYGIAMKLITDLTYESVNKIDEPLFNKVAFAKDIPNLLYKKLIENNILEKKSNTIFSVSEPIVPFTKLSWHATPTYSIQFFLEGLPLNIFNKCYIKKIKGKNKLNATKISKLFTNVNTDWFFEGRRKTTDNLNKHKDIAILKKIIDEVI
jgi:hypothetical protein